MGQHTSGYTIIRLGETREDSNGGYPVFVLKKYCMPKLLQNLLLRKKSDLRGPTFKSSFRVTKERINT